MRAAWPALVALFAVLAGDARAAEIEFRHINDLFSGSRSEDDLYTATIGLGGTVKGWTIELEEYLFTDKLHALRFDETYLTVARDLLRADSKWSLRARVGAARLGEGIYGESFQNFTHDVFGQDEVHIPYVAERTGSMFVRVNVARTLLERRRTGIGMLLEAESAGFKRHARAAVAIRRELGAGFALRAEGGTRHTASGYAPLARRILENEPTGAVGVAYRDTVALTWTSNYFGTGDRHWRLDVRLRFGAREAS